MEDGFLNPCSSFSIRVVVDAFHSIRSILSFPSRPLMKIQYDSCKKSPLELHVTKRCAKHCYPRIAKRIQLHLYIIDIISIS